MMTTALPSTDSDMADSRPHFAPARIRAQIRAANPAMSRRQPSVR
jgi:hypothetical protein